jgi:hypothetical protein
MYEDDDCFMFQKDSMRLTFVVWDCRVSNVAMGCCSVDSASVYVIVHYDDAFGATKLFKGEAWTADATRRVRAGMSETVAFLEQMRTDAGALRARIVYDGEMSVDKDFDLHLQFDHPVKKTSLLVKDVAKGSNPLLVIDSFI